MKVSYQGHFEMNMLGNFDSLLNQGKKAAFVNGKM